MLRIATILSLVASITLHFGSASAGDKQARPNYYPLKEGSKWHYRVDIAGLGQESFVVEATKTEKIDGISMTRLETSKGGQVLSSEHLSGEDRGVFKHRVNDQPLSKPMCMLKYPVTPGETWKEDVEMLGQKVQMTFKVGKGMEEVQVPAGKFKAISLRAEADFGGMNVATTYWFAADVGVVKQAADVFGQKLTMELEKLEKK